jgi:general secretion pathway protein C
VVSLPKALRLDEEALPRVLERAPRIVTFALVVLLGGQVAMVVTGLAGARRVPVPDGGAAPPPLAVPSAPQGTDVRPILLANLFGQAAPAAGSGANAPVTSLALVLVGVIADADPLRGFAILGPSAAAARVFPVGNVVPGGAKLHSVYADRIIIDRGGSLETLPLPRRQGNGVSSVPVAAPLPVAAPATRMQQIVQQNPGVIGDIIRPQAVLADGRQRGYRVYPGPNQQAFGRLGLRAGDLVTAINGTPLDDASRGAEIFGTLASSAEARITVMRSGRQQDLVLNLAEVVAEAERLGSAPGGGPAPGPVDGSAAAAR